MASAVQVAALILEKSGPMTAMKLQKLVYYCQAWSLVWDATPLFSDRIEAWANGPVVPQLYRQHRGKFEVGKGDIQGDVDCIVGKELATVQAVLNYYGNRDPFWLSQLTHAEAPWRDARKGLQPGERGSSEITLAAMSEYYGSLV